MCPSGCIRREFSWPGMCSQPRTWLGILIDLCVLLVLSLRGVFRCDRTLGGLGVICWRWRRELGQLPHLKGKPYLIAYWLG